MEDQRHHNPSGAVDCRARRVRVRLSLGAVLIGIVAAIAVQLILTWLGSGIGFSVIDLFARVSLSGTTLAVSAGVWWIVTSWIALFCGAWLAGKLIYPDRSKHEMAFGAVIWTFTTILVVFILGMAITAIVEGTAIGQQGSESRQRIHATCKSALNSAKRDTTASQSTTFQNAATNSARLFSYLR